MLVQNYSFFEVSFFFLLIFQLYQAIERNKFGFSLNFFMFPAKQTYAFSFSLSILTIFHLCNFLSILLAFSHIITPILKDRNLYIRMKNDYLSYFIFSLFYPIKYTQKKFFLFLYSIFPLFNLTKPTLNLSTTLIKTIEKIQ